MSVFSRKNPNVKSARRFAFPFLAACAVSAGSFMATFAFHSYQNNPARAAEPVKAPAPESVAVAGDMSAAFRTVHRAVKDAVVNINVTKKVAARMIPNEIPEEFRRFFPDIPEGPRGDRSSKVFGTGSGVIVSADGYVLTNNHVVDDAEEITVRLDTGREYKAKTIGRDPKSDLAVIKIEPAAGEKFTFAKLGDSENLEVGDWVLAFGSPFGFDQSMTQGIISAKGRSNANIIGSNNPALAGMTYENFLQTDAAINPGNSGGPLVNLKAEVVGINTAIASRTGSYNGIGFAIPSNDAKYIMESLIKNGKIVRGYMGVGIVDIQTPEISARLKKEGYTHSTGVLVESVQPESPGGKGGLQAGDIITSVNGKNADSLTFVRNAVARTRPGDKVELKVWRDGKAVDVTFAVGEQPEINPIRLASAERAPADPTPALGLSVESLDEATAKKYSIKPGGGVMITDVAAGSLAADSGLRAGDVVTTVNRTTVGSAEQFAAAVKKGDLAQGIRLTIKSADGAQRLVYLEKR